MDGGGVSFPIRGVVEGFYGVFYTAPQRDDLVRFLGRHGFNYYLYGPKNDRQHRARWREPYPERVLDAFARTNAIAREADVTFAYALSPGASMGYGAPEDFDALTAKLRAFYGRGVRAFSLFLDDIRPEFSDARDRARYRRYAEAHVDLGNRLYAWLQALDPAVSLSVCPTDYHGSPPFGPYLHELGAGLHPAIDLFYTGLDVCARTITAAEVEAFTQATQRPPILWDNYPVNDLAMQAELHLGPLRGRDPALAGRIRGILANPMIQPEASKIPLATLAAFLANPAGYDPETTWDAAVAEAAGDVESAAALRLLAAHTRRSCLAEPASQELAALTQAVLERVRRGEPLAGRPAEAALEAHLTAVDEATYHLKFRLENLALRQELLPWIESLEHWLWAARGALAVLRARATGQPAEAARRPMLEAWEAARRHPKHTGGEVLGPLVEVANG
jgi:hyaluronoglucosaminidase